MTDTLTPAPPGIRPCQGCETGIKNGPDNLCEACRRQAMGWLPPTIPGCVVKDPCAAPDDCRQLMCPNLKARSHHADGNRNPATTNVPTPAPPGTETAAGGYPTPTYPPKTDDWKDGYRQGMAYCLATLQPLMNDDHGMTAVREAVRMLHGRMPTITPAPADSGFATRFLSDAGKDGGLVRRKPADIDDAPDMIANPPVTEPEDMRQPPAPEPMCMWRATAPCAMGRCVYRACPRYGGDAGPPVSDWRAQAMANPTPPEPDRHLPGYREGIDYALDIIAQGRPDTLEVIRAEREGLMPQAARECAYGCLNCTCRLCDDPKSWERANNDLPQAGRPEPDCAVPVCGNPVAEVSFYCPIHAAQNPMVMRGCQQVDTDPDQPDSVPVWVCNPEPERLACSQCGQRHPLPGTGSPFCHQSPDEVRMVSPMRAKPTDDPAAYQAAIPSPEMPTFRREDLPNADEPPPPGMGTPSSPVQANQRERRIYARGFIDGANHANESRP